MKQILIIDDDISINDMLDKVLARAGYETFHAWSGTEALLFLKDCGERKPDLILLDLMLPGLSGEELLPQIGDVPVIVMSARTDVRDKVNVLLAGAADYITKPFSPKVLIARIRSVLRRIADKNSASAESGEIQVGSIRIIPKKHEVYVRDESVELSAAEFSILLFLAEHPGQVFSRQQIIHAVKGDGYPVTDRSVDVQILSIRRKLGDSPEKNSVDNGLSLIETIRGVGYRLRENI